MKVQFKLIVTKIDANGEAPIYLHCFFNGKDFRFYTKEKCNPKDWDDKKQRFRKSMLGYQEANDYLDTLEERTKKAFREYMQKGILPSPTLLKNELLPEVSQTSPKPTTFFTIYDKFLEDAHKTRQKSTMVNYKTI